MANAPSRINKELTSKFAVERNTFKRAVKDNPKDKIEIEIGDSKTDDFKPQVKLMRWNNEVNFSIRAEEHPQAQIQTKGKVVKYVTPEYEIHQYELDADEVNTEGGFEFEWVLPQKPSTNVFTATIQTKDLDFFYQPPLTPEEIGRGAVRPENVVGSYAVYHKSKGGMNDANGMEYKTGKAFHIYRPKVKDANGNWTWGKLHIDVEKGLLTVTVPQEFLHNAVYPVIVDPTFGYTSIGASNQTVASATNDTSYCRGFTQNLNATGTLDKITAALCVSSVGYDIDTSAALFEEDSAANNSHNRVALIERLALTYTTSYQFFDFTASNELLPKNNYILAVIADGEDVGGTAAARLAYDTGGASTNKYSETTTGAGSYATRKAENPWTETKSADTDVYSIYATYTATSFPATTTARTTGFATSVTSMAVNLPPAIASGDLLLAFVEVRNAGTWTPPTNWNELDAQLGGGSVGELTVFYKIADGTEGATASWTASTGTTAIWHVRRITNWHGTTVPEVTKTSGDASIADPPSLTPSWGADNTLWFAISGHTASSASAWSAGPSGYSDFLCSGASSGGAAVSIASAYKVANASSEDPGTLTVSGSNRWWAAVTIGVRPSAGGGSSSSIKELSGVAQASIKKVSGVAIANVKKVAGVVNS
jgi:hypothetical protein